jgi:hypothetical protein
MSVLDELKALDAQRAALLEGAKKEALDKAEKAIAELNELGFNYRLVEGAVRAPRKAEAEAPKRQTRGCALSDMRVQNEPSSRRASTPITKDQEAVHRCGASEIRPDEGWVVFAGGGGLWGPVSTQLLGAMNSLIRKRLQKFALEELEKTKDDTEEWSFLFRTEGSVSYVYSPWATEVAPQENLRR